VPGLTAGVVYLHGDNIDTVNARGGEAATALRVGTRPDHGYVVQSGALKNLGVAWKNATWRTDTRHRSQDENRLIVSYSIPLL
jgi:hypothetical protein